MPFLFSIDAHAAGEPCRLVHSGVPRLDGETMEARRHEFQSHHDWIRSGLMHEPRGHGGMFGALLMPAVRPTSAYGLIFFDTRGYLDGCGHATLCSALVWRRTMGPPGLPFDIDNPDGSVTGVLELEGEGDAARITLAMPVASVRMDHLCLRGLRNDPAALAHCGNSYVVVEAAALGLRHLPGCRPDDIRAAAREVLTRVPPEAQPASGTLEVLLYQRLEDADGPVYATAVFFSAHQIDRSPCGTGSSALAAVLRHRRELSDGERFQTVGPSGESFELSGMSDGRADGSALRVRLTGSAQITGVHQWIFSDSDVLRPGFLLE